MKKRIAVFLLALGVICSAGASVSGQPVLAAEEEHFENARELELSYKQIINRGSWQAIQEALDEARDYASDSRPYVITIEPGEYDLVGLLRIYSNTKLVLNGVTLNGDDGKNVIRVGEMDEKSSGVTGYHYRNIEIEGGILEGGNHKNTVLKVAHVENFKMIGVTLQNTYNAHLMEVAGVDGLVIENCVFQNQKLDPEHSARSYEAVQLDVLEYSHMGDCRSEDLGIKNVVIDNCTFTNVPRGVGSHTNILNNPFEGIRITNCTFDKISSAAVQAQGWIDCTISGNTITNAPRGIAYYSVMNSGEGTFLSTVLAKQGGVSAKYSVEYIKPAEDQNIVISNNTIILNEVADPYVDYERTAILLSGKEVTKVAAYGDGSGNIPVGNYYLSGITIKENIIKTTGQGIRLFDAKNVKITGNSVTYVKSADAGDNNYYGIQVTERCEAVSIDHNVVSDSDSNAIYVVGGSTADSVSTNTVINSGKYGIDIQEATVKELHGNRVINSASNAIYVVNNSKVDSVNANTVFNSGKYGIDIQESTVKELHGNHIMQTANRGIFIYTDSTVDIIRHNTISNTTNYAIQVSTNCVVNAIVDNWITNPGNYGIMYCENSNGQKITRNHITGAAKNAVSVTKDSSVDDVSDNK